jgi:hypothetical protein
MASTVEPALIAAYEATHYVILDGESDLVLRIGRHDAAMDDLLDRHGVTVAAIITACNPESVVLAAAENARRQAELRALLQGRGFHSLPAEGRDPAGDWIAEASCCALGIDLDQAKDIGRQFRQNAIVFISRGVAAALVLLR